MPKETVAEKASRLIFTGAIRFIGRPTRQHLEGRCTGDTDDYEFAMNYGRWGCSCPNPKGSCSHLLAAKAIFRAIFETLPEEDRHHGSTSQRYEYDTSPIYPAGVNAPPDRSRGAAPARPGPPDRSGRRDV